jgi:hypothetical protein
MDDFSIDPEYEIEEARRFRIRAKACKKLGMDDLGQMFEDVARLCDKKVRIYRMLLEVKERLRPKVQ